MWNIFKWLNIPLILKCDFDFIIIIDLFVILNSKVWFNIDQDYEPASCLLF